jgi:hypothetical protein
MKDKLELISQYLDSIERFSKDQIESWGYILEKRHNPSCYGTKRITEQNMEKAIRLRVLGMTYKRIGELLHRNPSRVACYFKIHQLIKEREKEKNESMEDISSRR